MPTGRRSSGVTTADLLMTPAVPLPKPSSRGDISQADMPKGRGGLTALLESQRREAEEAAGHVGAEQLAADAVHIRATIMVERDSQKGIVIGKKGAMLKKIGKMARRDIEIMLGDKVYLETWVKVKKNWRDKKLDLADFGYNEKEY